jgi:hypothetical protein
MLDTFLRRATEDLPVYITEVRDAFQTSGSRPFHIQVMLYDKTVRRFALRLPELQRRQKQILLHLMFMQPYIISYLPWVPCGWICICLRQIPA